MRQAKQIAQEVIFKKQKLDGNEAQIFNPSCKKHGLKLKTLVIQIIVGIKIERFEGYFDDAQLRSFSSSDSDVCWI